MENIFNISAIGVIRKSDQKAWIEVNDTYKDAMLGLDGFSHIHVLYWFHENDTPQLRAVRQVHPRRDSHNPLTGIFATHSPMRPNLIALALCRITAIRDMVIDLEDIDARDGSPLIDIKCYIPYDNIPDIRLPDWVNNTHDTEPASIGTVTSTGGYPRTDCHASPDGIGRQ